jgi:hypothetical protein
MSGDTIPQEASGLPSSVSPSTHLRSVSDLMVGVLVGSRVVQLPELATKTADARLFVSSVSPGSIDISFLPDIVVGAAVAFAPLVDKFEAVQKYGKRIKSLLDFFAKKDGKDVGAITVKDCDDAINIVKPVAEHGGSQTFTVINGGLTVNVLTTTQADALKIIEGAANTKAQLLMPNADTRQQVAMTWARLDREEAKVKGTTSPDKGVIEEIDPNPKAVLFTDAMAAVKKDMISDTDNPLQAVYFVDVQIVRVGGKIVAYRVIAYHGKDELDGPTNGSSHPTVSPS